MRWTHIAGRNCCATSDACADGEVVWSWRSDAGAKSAVRSADDGGNQAWSPRRSRISRNTIAQGMPAVAVYPWLLTPVLSFCTGGHGCNAHPAFPAPSFDFEGGSFPTHLGHFVPRERTVAPHSAVMLRESGASSMQRRFGSITAASGILDRPVIPDRAGDRRRAMTRIELERRTISRWSIFAPSCPGLSRASTSSFVDEARTWMAGTGPAMTA